MRRRTSGHVLMVAIVVVLIVGSAAALLFMHHSLQARLSHQHSRNVRLIALNDAAVAEALAALAASPVFRGSAPHSFGGGEIGSRVRPAGEDRRVVVATATYSGWTRRTRVEVMLASAGPRVQRWQLVRASTAAHEP